MEFETFESLKGQFLIAMPGLVDPNFHQTVSFLCEHTPDGAVGIVLNRVHDTLRLENIFSELNLEVVSEIGSQSVHIGGPVNNNQIFILHGPPYVWEGSIQVSADIAMSNTLDIFTALSKGEGPESFIVSLGCAGWGPGQLESELVQNAWLTAPAVAEVIFEIPLEKRWQEAVKRMGIDPVLLTDAAGHA
jgi:putative transcriptional regulator